MTPKASRARWEAGDPVRVWVTAPPTDGQANEAVERLLAEAIGVPRTCVTVVRGHASREKRVRIESLTEPEVRDRLGP